MATQLVTPNPNIWCRPGWCLQYVREAFGIPRGVQPTATAGWEASPTKHRDWNFPSGVWIPVWFSLRFVPAGHVALMAPDGSVYSTSDDSNTPHHHPDLSDLIAYYNRYGQPITYLGWTEDIENVTVIDLGEASYGYDGEITPTIQEDELSAEDVSRILSAIENIAAPGESGKRTAGPLYDLAQDVRSINTALLPGEAGVRHAGAVYAALDALKGNTATLDPVQLAAAIKASLPAELAKQVVTELGTALGGK